MSKNVGTVDKILRIVVGVALIAFALMKPDISWSWVGWIGVVPILTAVLGICPAYSLLGVSTCPRKGDA